ncbi:MAG: TRAP transporter small permease [Planctomycetota bacterium]|jgi:TRAP-type C4-dicarboxylate transport system permease small subunit
MVGFERLEKTATRVTRIIALIGLVGLLALASATVLDVLLRWIFNSPIVGLNDTHSLFTALIIASCFPLCIYRRGNITIRFIGNIFGPRVSHILDAFGNLVTLIIFFLMTWQLWLYTDKLLGDGETTWVLNWPVSPWWRVVTILIFTCVPVTLLMFIRDSRSAFRKKGASDQLDSS